MVHRRRQAPGRREGNLCAAVTATRRLADCACPKVGLEEVYATVRDTLPLWRDYLAVVRDLLD